MSFFSSISGGKCSKGSPGSPSRICGLTCSIADADAIADAIAYAGADSDADADADADADNEQMGR